MVYMVVRDCCTSGNCITCQKVPRDPVTYQKKMPKVCQFLTHLESMANQVQENWKSYGAYVRQAVEDEIAELTPDSAAWVRDSLLRPDTINNITFVSRPSR